ncbi:MAG: thioredoxin family protein [Marinilabiliales bacterium]|jgi:small redox-active disulfide protein 2|nr:MAG: thioredoxin family protein [Marinilabiliales bacterium]
MDIKILGTGCPNCKVLERTTREVVEEMGLQAQITKEEDIMKIMEYGVMRTPALVVDNKVVLSGRVPSRNEVKKLLTV